MTAHAEPFLPQLQRLLGQANTDACDDANLLQRFVARRDETAFAALLARHGPMVFGVCHRILRDDQEAEDALQATFLLFARKANGLRHPETLAAWLYGVARRLALTTQRSIRRRRQRERDRAVAEPARSANPLDELSTRELFLMIDEELSRLPERYRLPLILCGLEGRSQAEAARLLGWTAASVRGRLERGRKRLRSHLVRRGMTLVAGLLALESMATATVSATLRKATMKMALTFAAGSSEGIAANVLALVETATTGMTMTKAKAGLMLLLALGLAGSTGVLAYPLGNEKLVEIKQAKQTKSPEQNAETPKSTKDKQIRTDLYGDPLPGGAIARLGTTRFRHGGWLREVLVSPDGRTLISAGLDSIEWWDARSGKRQRRITSSSPSFYSIALSADGKLLAVANSSNKMRFWNLVSGAEVSPFGEDAPVVLQTAFSLDGKWMATRDAKVNPNTVSIWTFGEKKKIRTIEAGGRLYDRSLAFSPDSKMLAFPGADDIRIWDVTTDKELHRLGPKAKEAVGCLRFSFDGKLLVSTSVPYKLGAENIIHLWDVATGKEIGVLKGHESTIDALAMSPKSNLLVSSSWEGGIRLWDLDTQKELGKFPARRSRKMNAAALAFTADGRTLVSGNGSGVISLWDTATRQEIASPASGANCVGWAAFSPDGKTLITTGNEQIGTWEPLTGRPRQIFNAPSMFSYHPALSTDGKVLATRSDWRERQAVLWDVATGKLVRRFGEGGQAASVSSCALSKDSRLLATGSYPQDIIRIWDAVNGKELHQLKGQKLSLALAFAPDGATLASASTDGSGDFTVRLWKIATGEEIWRKVTRPWTAFNLQFSPDGSILALVGGMPGRLNTTGEVRLWDAATGKELRRCEGHRERVGCLAFSPDGRMLATGSQDNTVRLWEIATGQERQCLNGHQHMIMSVSFSPDGRLLASASADSTALVWDLTCRFRDGHFQPRRLSADEVDRCWADLAGADAPRAYRSIVALTGSPKETASFLKDRLPPVTVADPKRVAPLLAALDSDQFAERDKAMTELENLGFAVEPTLRKALNDKPSLEVRRRIETILQRISSGPRLRFLRALEVLEQIGTAEAREILERLSQGSAELWPTQEAKTALRRRSPQRD